MARTRASTGKAGAQAKHPSRSRKPADDDADRTLRETRLRQKIIGAAAEAYRQYGYEATGMSDIAQRVGLTAPALYWYFPSKEDILFAFLEHTIQHLYRFTSDSINSTDPVARLRELMHAYVLWQLHQRDITGAYERIYALGHLRNSLPVQKRDRIKALERQFYGLFRDVVIDAAGGQGLPKGRAKAVTFALIGMVEHLNAWFQPEDELSVAQVAILYAEMAVRMAAGAYPTPGSAQPAAAAKPA